jgi:acetyl-CoA acetyltransferase
MPVDAAVAVILARADRAGDLRHSVARIEAMSCAPGPALEHDLMDFGRQSSYYIGRELWTKTDLTPSDVDLVELYDGFSFQPLHWLEDLGFCGRGDAGPMIAEGRCRVGGELPVCTDGGQLGVGRYHGLEKLAQAARQLWGGADAMQVDGAEVSLACAGGGPRGAAMLLTKA